MDFYTFSEYSPAATTTSYHQRHRHHNHSSVDDEFVAPSAIYRTPPPTENHASTVASHGHYQNLISSAMDEDAVRGRRRKSSSAFRSEVSADRKSRSRSRRYTGIYKYLPYNFKLQTLNIHPVP